MIVAVICLVKIVTWGQSLVEYSGVRYSYSGVLVIALGNVFLVERSGRGDYVKERGDPCTERLPERGTTREKGSKADPTAAGDSETERAE